MATTPYVAPNHGFWPVQWTELKISRNPQTNDLDAFDVAEQHIPIATTPYVCPHYMAGFLPTAALT